MRPIGIQNAAATSRNKNMKKRREIREIQVHKLWTKVYAQKGLTAMVIILFSNYLQWLDMTVNTVS